MWTIFIPCIFSWVQYFIFVWFERDARSIAWPIGVVGCEFSPFSFVEQFDNCRSSFLFCNSNYCYCHAFRSLNLFFATTQLYLPTTIRFSTNDMGFFNFHWWSSSLGESFRTLLQQNLFFSFLFDHCSKLYICVHYTSCIIVGGVVGVAPCVKYMGLFWKS